MVYLFSSFISFYKQTLLLESEHHGYPNDSNGYYWFLVGSKVLVGF